jgi:NAD(P)-dependent dehydrogenase (short-subunit alcohol dehydrogenase family)
MGSTGPADAATGAFIRHLAAEVGPQGVRVLGIHQGRDEAAFAELVGRYRRELHCHRMLGSFEEAEDLGQETFPRAWRRRDSFEGGPGFRAWRWSSCSRPGSGRS